MPDDPSTPEGEAASGYLPSVPEAGSEIEERLPRQVDAASPAGGSETVREGEFLRLPEADPEPDGGLPPRGERARWWSRRIVACVGLLLFAGCLFALLSGGSLPSWRFPERATPTASGEVAVVIDPGHGGWDTGAVAQGVREKDLNLDVGLRVAKALEARGLRTKLTRDDDRFIPLSGRARIANALPGAIFVSIHFNDAPSEGRSASRANGIETFYSEFKEAPPLGVWTLASLLGGKDPALPGPTDPARAISEGRNLADSIQASLVNGTAAIDRGIKERSLYVTRRVQGPAVLVEGGFVSHPAEARLLGDPNYRQRLAESIAGGIVKYLAAAPPRATGSPLAATLRNPHE